MGTAGLAEAREQAGLLEQAKHWLLVSTTLVGAYRVRERPVDARRFAAAASRIALQAVTHVEGNFQGQLDVLQMLAYAATSVRQLLANHPIPPELIEERLSDLTDEEVKRSARTLRVFADPVTDQELRGIWIQVLQEQSRLLRIQQDEVQRHLNVLQGREAPAPGDVP